MEKTGVAVVGMGTVGSGVARLLLDHGDRTARHAGRTLWLTHAVVKHMDRSRQFQLPDGVLTDDLNRVIEDKSVSVVAQLIGGVGEAREIMLKLLGSGKDIVTANKALLAEHGPELFDYARQLNRSIAFEASIAGGRPIVNTMSQCFSANQIVSLRGILVSLASQIILDDRTYPFPCITLIRRFTLIRLDTDQSAILHQFRIGDHVFGHLRETVWSCSAHVPCMSFRSLSLFTFLQRMGTNTGL